MTGGEGLAAVLVAKAWLLLAALIGSLTGAYFIRPRTRWEWVFTIGAGFFAAVFVVPAVVAIWLPGVPGSDGRVGAIYYSFALLAMVAIPPIMRAVERRIAKFGEGG